MRQQALKTKQSNTFRRVNATILLSHLFFFLILTQSHETTLSRSRKRKLFMFPRLPVRFQARELYKLIPESVSWGLDAET